MNSWDFVGIPTYLDSAINLCLCVILFHYICTKNDVQLYNRNIDQLTVDFPYAYHNTISGAHKTEIQRYDLKKNK